MDFVQEIPESLLEASVALEVPAIEFNETMDITAMNLTSVANPTNVVNETNYDANITTSVPTLDSLIEEETGMFLFALVA